MAPVEVREPVREQVHLDVNRCLQGIAIHSTTRAFVPRGVRLDLALRTGCSENLAAANPRGLVGLREVHECAEVKGHLQDGVGNDFRCLGHVTLDGHITRQAVCVGEGHRLDSDGMIIIFVICDVLTMTLTWAPEPTGPHMDLLPHL